MENLEASADLLKELMEESVSLLDGDKLNCQALYERLKDKYEEIHGYIWNILCYIYYQCQNGTYKWKQIETDHRHWDTIFQRYNPEVDDSLTNPSTNLFKRKYSCEAEPEEVSCKRASIKNVENAGTYREAVPLHFLFKIDSFSLLPKNSILKYESSVFETGGYKWKLSLYPTGNTNENGYGHISLYLELVDTSVPDCWEFTVSFKLFIYDNIRHRYFFRGTNTFHEMNKVWGFPTFLLLSEFNDPASGFLVNDSCVFGAEVFVSRPPGDIERLSMFMQTTTVEHIWKIKKFLQITEEFLYSEKFEAGGYFWDILIYPRGNFVGKNNSVSLYLHFSDFGKDDPGLKVCTNFKLRIRNLARHVEFSAANHWFGALQKNWGWPKFMGLSQMRFDEDAGNLVYDTFSVEAEVEVLGVVSKRRGTMHDC